MGAKECDRRHEILLVLRAQMGDRAAFHELVDHYQQRLLYFVRRIVPANSDCQDVLQDIWLHAFRSLGRLRAAPAFRVWLYRIAHDRAATHVRRQVGEAQTYEDLGMIAEDSANSNDLELLEDVEAVHAALERLTRSHREVLALRFLEDMSVNEIAEVLQCHEGTVKSRLHYAKLAIRRLLEGDRHE
jgi:RNA polymerase sigma-70 factor, ECF subfamily